MNVANHFITGAVLATAIRQPVVALPLAYVSHFALDALPHFGFNRQGYGTLFRHKITYIEELFNVCAFILTLYVLRDQSVLVYIAGFIAVSPDIMWPYRYLLYERHGQAPPRPGFITRFHLRIQWGERPWFVVAEMVWFLALFALLFRLL